MNVFNRICNFIINIMKDNDVPDVSFPVNSCEPIYGEEQISYTPTSYRPIEETM
jgi:hypothetical protein